MTNVQDGYATYSAMIYCKINPSCSVQLNLDNMLDKRYYTQIDASSVVYGEPRNFTLNLNTKF